MTAKEPVSVLGAAMVGAALVRSLARSGRAVIIGVRHPDAEDVRNLVEELGSGSVATTPRDAIAASEVVIAAVPGVAMAGLIDACATELAGRIVLDATNNLSEGHASGKLSALPCLAAAVPTALGYRAFNSVGWENMADPSFNGVQADLFYAGPDISERTAVERLITDVGFRPQYVGAGADAHLAVDTLTTLWFALAFGQKRGRHLALRLLTDT